MKTRDRIIIGLVAFGLLLFGTVEFVIIPQNNAKEQAYIAAQQEPVTNDLNNILPFKNKYMGNSSNDANLFYRLPLSDVGLTFGVDSTNRKLEVYYKATVENIGKEKAQRALLYNSTAAFALIDNLSAIEYNFTGASFEVKRADIVALYSDFSGILQKDRWKSDVQDKINDNAYVNRIFKAVFIQKNS